MHFPSEGTWCGALWPPVWPGLHVPEVCCAIINWDFPQHHPGNSHCISACWVPRLRTPWLLWLPYLKSYLCFVEKANSIPVPDPLYEAFFFSLKILGILSSVRCPDITPWCSLMLVFMHSSCWMLSGIFYSETHVFRFLKNLLNYLFNNFFCFIFFWPIFLGFFSHILNFRIGLPILLLFSPVEHKLFVLLSQLS